MNPDQDKSTAGGPPGWPDVAIRLMLLALIVYWSFLLLRPFIEVLIWAAILSVATHPIHLWLKRVLGGRSTLTSFLLTVLALLVILGPVSTLGAVLVNNLSAIAKGITEGTIVVPPPPPYVSDWPLVGGELSALWETASRELGQFLASIKPQLKEVARKLLQVIGNVGIGVLQLSMAIIIAGFTHNRATGIQAFLKNAATRAAPRLGESFVDLAGKTVRGVARGVVGISLIQSILFGVGALAADIPLPGLLTFMTLVLSIVQVGPGLVILPVIIFGWSSMDTVSATMFTAYMVPVMLMDNVLKPIVMGSELPVPTLVIFIGVISGTITHGLIGVFVGPIVLSLGYELGRAWVAVARASSKS